MVHSIDEMKYCPEMPKTPKKIVIIGTGGIVTGSHLPAYKLAGYPVVGVYDQIYEKAEAAAKEY